MQDETIAAGLEPAANTGQPIDIIQEPSLPELSEKDIVRKGLVELAETNADDIEVELKLKEMRKRHNIGIKTLRQYYSNIKASLSQKKTKLSTPDLTQEEVVAQAQLDLAGEHKQEEVNKKVKILQQTPDLLSTFHNSLGATFISNDLLAASFLLWHGSRLLNTSSAFIFTGASGSGKSDGVLKASKFLPPEMVLSLTSVSEQALYYLDDISGKFLMFGEMSPRVDGNDDFRQEAMRQLISENELTRASVEKVDGRQNIFVQKKTTGPCVITATTTKEQNKFNDELQNRVSWVTSDDSNEITQAVLEAIAENATNPVRQDEGHSDLDIAAWQEFHRTLKAMPVEIPYARKIKPRGKHVTVRRLSKLILNYVRAYALLHQHSRERKTIRSIEFIVATKADYSLAYRVVVANAPRVLETCAPPARKAFDNIIKPALEGGKVMSTGEIQKLIGEPYSTVARWLNELKKSGPLICHEVGKQCSYQLNTEISNHFTQDLGLVHPSALFEDAEQKSELQTQAYTKLQEGISYVVASLRKQA